MKYFDRFLSAPSTLSRRVHAAAMVALALLTLTGSAIAQDTSTGTTSSAAGTTAAAPRRPARKPFRAARLTYMEGDVRVEQANSTANSIAAINMPLVEGTVISSGPNGQAEIEFEDGSVARLTPNSGLSLVHLTVDYGGNFQTRLALLGGLIYLELRGGTKYLYAVDAGGDVISPVENTTIRVNFDEPPASVAVLDGTAHFATAGKSFMDATAGQTVQTDPSSDGSVLLVKSTIAPETWDQWNEDRDQAAASEAGSETDARAKFAGSQGYGWSDLDVNGSWYDVPGHGEVWQPDIAATVDDTAGDDQSADNSGFDPYGYGSWAYTPAGYAWASGYGWGWLPYRCGQWSFYPGFGWGWSPDPYCGTYGFGGYGYGYDLNFGFLPPHYRRPVRPIPGPGPIHPIRHGRVGPVPVAPVHRLGSGPGRERVIAGVTVHALPPVGNTFSDRSGFSARPNSALSRDYPIDTKTHTPITGLVATIHGVPAAGSTTRAAWQSAEPVNGASRGSYSPQRPSPPLTYDGGSQPTPVYRPTPAPSQHQSAPVQHQSAPVQHQSAPSVPRSSPAPTSHSAPATSSPSPKGK